MHGFIHILLEDFIDETLGREHILPIRGLAGIDRPPVMTAYYRDEETVTLIKATAQHQRVHPDDTMYAFGRYIITSPLIYHNYQALTRYTSARAFLDHLDLVYRYLFSHTSSGTSGARLTVVDHGLSLLEVSYQNRQSSLCRLIVGLIVGTGERFNESLEVEEWECQLQGASACRLGVRFLGVAPGPPPLNQLTNESPTLPNSPVPESFSVVVDAQPSRSDSKPGRERHEDEELLLDKLVLELLASGLSPHPASRERSGANAPSGFTLFEIQDYFRTHVHTQEHSIHSSRIQQSLIRLSAQRFIEAASASSGEGSSARGQGGKANVFAHLRYRATVSGKAWLDEQRYRLKRE